MPSAAQGIEQEERRLQWLLSLSLACKWTESSGVQVVASLLTDPHRYRQALPASTRSR